MFNLKKIISLILLCVLLISVSGCRTKDPVATGYNGPTIELKYYKVFDKAEVMEPLIRAYQAQNPGVKITYKTFDDFSEYQKAVIDEMAEGAGPDIFSMQNTWFIPNYKKLIPMPAAKGNPDVFSKTFVEVAYNDLVRPDENGVSQVYGIPLTVDSLALYYNKDHFEDRIPERGYPASTWGGIKEDVKLLNKKSSTEEGTGSGSVFDVSGIAMGRADNISRAVDIVYLLFLQYGVDFYDDKISQSTFSAHSGSGDVAYPGMEALKLFTSFSRPDSDNYSWDQYIADEDSSAQEIATFAAGKVSMIVGYAYTYDEIMKEIDSLNKTKGVKGISKDAVKVVPIPQLVDPKKSTEKRVTYASYFAETVSKNCKNPDIAWDFLIFMSSKENEQKYFEKTHKPTSLRAMIDEQKKDPIYGVFAEQIGYAESFPIVDYYRYKEIFTNVINQANAGGVSTAELGDASTLIDNMLPMDGFMTTAKKIDTKKKTTPEEEKEKMKAN